jgi:hypothetical protein
MKNNIKAQPYIQLAAIAITTMLLCSMAFYNSFPLVFNNDTGLYIDAAHTGMVRFDRPIFYGLFLRFTSLQQSLWLTVIIQALIVSLVIHYYFRHFSTGPNYILWFIGYIAFISFLMKGAFIASWLMPDIFTSVSIMCIGLLLFVEKFKRRDHILISMLTVLSIAMHNSHFFICMSIAILLFAGFAFRSIREKYKTVGIRKTRLGLIMLLAVISNLFLSGIHYSLGAGFKSSRGGPVFVMGSLVDMGIMEPYLAENCKKKNYDLCQYKDSIPGNFLWDVNSPVYLRGGWEQNEEEYTTIVKDVVTTPRYLKTFVYNSAIFTCQQFFHFNTSEAGKPTQPITDAIATYYPNEFERYAGSRQAAGALNFDISNLVQNIIAAACLFIYILVFMFNKTTMGHRSFFVFILASVLINAWVCGTFSGVFPRYQARVVWLLPLPIFLYLMQRFDASHLLQNTWDIINKEDRSLRRQTLD